jgi:hypothetical protein
MVATEARTISAQLRSSNAQRVEAQRLVGPRMRRPSRVSWTKVSALPGKKGLGRGCRCPRPSPYVEAGRQPHRRIRGPRLFPCTLVVIPLAPGGFQT